LNAPTAAALDLAGDLYIRDTGNGRIRKVTSAGIISTVASNLSSPQGLAFDAAGNLYVAEYANHRVLRIRKDGTISTFAGTGEPGASGDGGPAARATLNGPASLAFDDKGILYISELGSRRVRQVSPRGVISTHSNWIADLTPVPGAQPFRISRTEVTVEEYEQYLRATHGRMPRTTGYNKYWAQKRYPMTNVTRAEAGDYCRWAGGRLPTETEWEHAARAGRAGQPYPTGASIARDEAHFGALEMENVARFPANPLGVYDMAGSVSEWTEDGVTKGGSWYDPPKNLRVDTRGKAQPDKRSNTVGFRCVWQP
jgi:hypothetical protein